VASRYSDHSFIEQTLVLHGSRHARLNPGSGVRRFQFPINSRFRQGG
jgi:hypothetical protein